MNQVFIRFYEELNNYLPEKMRKVWVESGIESDTSVGEKIQSFEIPLEGVDLILVNEHSSGFDYILQPGDRISVYPEFETFDISALNLLRDEPLRHPKFSCDVHLGKLCKYLRMLGWDTFYSNVYSPEKLIELSHVEKRVLLSRSLQLTRQKQVTHALWVRSADPMEQVKEVIQKLDLTKGADALTRCLNCNEKLVLVEKKEILHRLEDRTANYYEEFFICQKCDQIYWKGSHFENMLEFIRQRLQKSEQIQ